jgi:hypothetical protein
MRAMCADWRFWKDRTNVIASAKRSTKLLNDGSPVFDTFVVRLTEQDTDNVSARQSHSGVLRHRPETECESLLLADSAIALLAIFSHGCIFTNQSLVNTCG